MQRRFHTSCHSSVQSQRRAGVFVLTCKRQFPFCLPLTCFLRKTQERACLERSSEVKAQGKDRVSGVWKGGSIRDKGTGRGSGKGEEGWVGTGGMVHVWSVGDHCHPNFPVPGHRSDPGRHAEIAFTRRNSYGRIMLATRPYLHSCRTT